MVKYYSNGEKNNFIDTFGLSDELISELSHVQLRTMLRKYITPENKINCACFLICNRSEIFEKMYKNDFVDLNDIIKCIQTYPKCASQLPQEIIKNDNFQKKLLENIQPEWYDFLPTFIANNPEIQKKCGRTGKVYLENGLDKNGYNHDWLNENGELISFFKLEENFPIKSKLDYYKLYKEYIESKISVQNFCNKYGIDSVKGFNEFLKRIESESLEDFSKIKEVKNDVQKNFFISSKETAEKLAKEELDFEEFINNSKYNFNSTKINLYFNALSLNDRNNLAKIIMDYVEKNPYLINENFIKFLTTNNMKPSDSFNTFIRKSISMPKDKEYIQKYKKQISKIRSQERPYKRNDLYSVYIIGEKEYKIDDSIIDQAYAYAIDKNYHMSYISMNYLCKKIATGEIVYSKETEQEKEEMISSIIYLIKEEKTIEDYIAEMKNRSTVKKK